jgi:hypothetical protein
VQPSRSQFYRVPGSGSFIRPSSSLNYGQTFLEALRSRYIELPHKDDSQETVLLGSSKGAILVEAVNLDKIRRKLSNLANLREASLDGENVAYSDPPGEIRKCCPSVYSIAPFQLAEPTLEPRYPRLEYISQSHFHMGYCSRHRK